ncbi:YybH family protein [Rhodococcus jostii]|uniref:SnoaL-like domain-containing protein n=1 Tax=Rhodococcus jostii TaxID=132919 RepID=A0A1H4WML6_RHOJO|nr:nuclear transport factor 2 family protein [Rhodococcus jostii]SEC94599.1 conserved hypothetical protein [Rhodococcus jostii]
MADTTTADVQDAIDSLIRAFGEHDTTAYFSSFSPDATFVFYTHPVPLPSRDAYQDLWTQWEADGFRVLECTSREQNVTFPAPDVAVLTHRVGTTVQDSTGTVELDERETILFRRHEGAGWIAVHEHLSPQPDS